MRVCGFARLAAVAVALSVTLPAQPADGLNVFKPLGGSGVSAPLGHYLCDISLDGDASGGNSTVTLILDKRYTNIVAWVNPSIEASAAAAEFICTVTADPVSLEATPRLVGTLPFVATTVSPVNSAVLWYPPPILYKQSGAIIFVTPNVGAGEDYIVRAQIFCFHDQVEQLTPYQWLRQVQGGANSPAGL